jgi:dolichyl-phosphate-mannose--protein O-mannosyl transferase
VFLSLDGSGAERSEIWTVPNLVVSIGGIVAMFALVRRALRDRSAALFVVFAAAAVQYLPWIAVGRVTFMYHYLPVVPFLALALGWLLAEGLREHPYERPITIGVVATAVAVFFWLYPILVGWQMPVAYLDGVRDVLPWVIP